MSALNVGAALPRRKVDALPALTPLIVMAVAAPFIGSFSTFLTLTAAGLAMGMMIFTMASGLTLVFGMMDVLNFGHGAFIALGAYVATLVLLPLAGWSSAQSVALNLAVFALAVIAAALACGALGWVFERLIVKPVYGQHLRQILATIGGSIIAEQLLYALFGPPIRSRSACRRPSRVRLCLGKRRWKSIACWRRWWGWPYSQAKC
jgi:branched-chain amino acid transport system permease protein